MADTTVKLTGEGKKQRLEISIPVSKKDSKSGKTVLIATTGGNMVTDVEVDGKKLVIGLNAYIPKD